ncbi:MAG: hydrogenase/urease accessory protein [Cyanobacteria bacterium RYN_339]|nr:hydrogenase/urease accessory protein [Cyanobacteria bacterium RYN_339]
MRRITLLAVAAWLMASSPVSACLADQTVGTVERGAKECTLELTFPARQLAAFDDDHDGRLSPTELKTHEKAIAATVGRDVYFKPAGEMAITPIETPDYMVQNAGPGLSLASLRVHVSYEAPPRRLLLHFGWYPLRTACGGLCVLTDHTGGGMSFFTLDADHPDRDLFADHTPIEWTTFFRQGFWHILTGYDHLLFLLALLLGGLGFKRKLGVVTAFTLAHSGALALAVTGWLDFPAAWVEAAIALTIAYAAFENLVRRESAAWPSVLLFGLIHGLGFADALKQQGLEGRELAPALLGYNVGVEAGQLLVVFLAYGLLLRHAGLKLRRAGSLGLVVVGAGWFVRRLAFSGF